MEARKASYVDPFVLKLRKTGWKSWRAGELTYIGG